MPPSARGTAVALRVLLADDHQLVRDALRLMLDSEPDIQVVAQASSGTEVLRLARQITADIVCMDIAMPDMLQAGAVGYVTKADAGDELLRAIRVVHQGQTYLCPAAAAAVTGAMRNNAPQGRFRNSQLGARERQVLQLVAEGHTSSRIAQMLHIAPSTVEVHRRNLMRKLDLHNVAELTTYALTRGVIGGQSASGGLSPEDKSQPPGPAPSSSSRDVEH